MNNKNNCAELVDIMNYRIAVGFLVVSIAYAFDVAAFLVAEPVINYLDWAGKITGVLAMLIIIRALWPVFNKKIPNLKAKDQEPESFMTETLHNSIRVSWLVSILFLTIIMVMDNLRHKLGLPADFYFKLLFFVMMFTVSSVFLFRTKEDDSIDTDPTEVS